MRRALGVIAAVLLGGCNASPTTPAPSPLPTPPPPEVTLSVSGWVRDPLDRAVPGARVEVTTGRLAGTFVTSNIDGGFAFAEPVPVSSQIKASKSGYVDAFLALSAATGLPVVFTLGAPDPSINLPGQYDVTFEADASCTVIPEAARKRTYLAALGPITELTGATFLGGDPPANVIFLSRFEEYVKVTMRDSYVWELISNASYVMISGEALGVVDPDVSQLVLDGEFKYCPNVVTGTATCSVETVSCRSSRHALTLKRR